MSKRTNFEKLVRWDADYYKSLSDDDCIVCLTEKQIYLIGQIIEPLEWVNTRWEGDISGLDFGDIAGLLEKAISERMTCQNLQTILDTITQIQITLNDIQNPAPDFGPYVTVINDNWTDEELAAAGVEHETCVDADKDALYGGISQLVRFMHQKNSDFFQEIAQAANFTEQIDMLKSSTGPLNVVPANNAFEFATFYIEELLQEYEATVDEELLQEVICDLFCIAVNSGCDFNLYDVGDYYASKVEPTFGNATTVFLDLLQFAALGTMSGDDYYYYATYFQFWLAGAGQYYLGITTLDTYITQFLAGHNSPDNDWSLFCIDCPTQYRLWTHDFGEGLGDFTLVKGTLEGGRIKGVDTGTNYEIELTMPFDSTWQAMAGLLHEERINSGFHGTGDADAMVFRATAGTNTGAIATMPGGGFLPSGEYDRCLHYSISPFHATGVVEVWIHMFASDIAGAEMYLDFVQILFRANHAPDDTHITEDGTLCS